jgi:hypothetical protein
LFQFEKYTFDYDFFCEMAHFLKIPENIQQTFATIISCNYPINGLLDSFRLDTIYRKLLSIVLKPASSLGYETDFWTCGRLCHVFHKTFGLKSSKWTIWRWLRDAGLTYQKPQRQYFEASEKDRKEGLKKELPKIRRTVKKHNAILYFEDEATISLTALLGKTWSLRGKTPVQKVTGKRGGVSAMSAISKKGNLIFTLHEKKLPPQKLFIF